MYTPILGTLGFILSPDRTKTLLIHRNARPDDAHFGKYNGLGGKMRAGEDIITCIKREIHEEAGINCLEIFLRGTINWTGFGPNGENWLGFIFRIDSFEGEPYRNNNEGELSWQPIENLSQLPMWEGDRLFLPMVFDEDNRAFHGHMPYKDGRPTGWIFSRV